jgi:hypothetical protein
VEQAHKLVERTVQEVAKCRQKHDTILACKQKVAEERVQADAAWEASIRGFEERAARLEEQLAVAANELQEAEARRIEAQAKTVEEYIADLPTPTTGARPLNPDVVAAARNIQASVAADTDAAALRAHLDSIVAMVLSQADEDQGAGGSQTPFEDDAASQDVHFENIAGNDGPKPVARGTAPRDPVTKLPTPKTNDLSQSWKRAQRDEKLAKARLEADAGIPQHDTGHGQDDTLGEDGQPREDREAGWTEPRSDRG